MTIGAASDDSLYTDYDANVLIVTHGGPIRALFYHFAKEYDVIMHGGLGTQLIINGFRH